jgi:heptosyltransferase-3
MVNKPENIKRILISRTDSIGDVALTLPMCVWLKKQLPHAELVYLGKAYTQPVISKFAVIDSFEDWSSIENLGKTEQIQHFKKLKIDAIIHVFPNKLIAKIAYDSGIRLRIGTAHRSFHWLTCNKLLNFSRKRSFLHESQLNFKLLNPFGLKVIPSFNEINKLIENQFLQSEEILPVTILPSIQTAKKTVILHPKSQGSAVEWPLEKYIELALQLVRKDILVIFSGTETEGLTFRDTIPRHENILDLTGKLSLEQYLALISKSHALVACSTGPLHIAGLYNIHAIGLFSPRRPIHPGRWKPLGSNVSILVHDENCATCNAGKECTCISEIPVAAVEQLIS